MERSINRLIILHVILHIGPHGNISEVSLNDGEFLAVELSRDFALLKDGEALVEPEVLPVLAGEIVTGP